MDNRLRQLVATEIGSLALGVMEATVRAERAEEREAAAEEAYKVLLESNDPLLATEAPATEAPDPEGEYRAEIEKMRKGLGQ